MADPDYVFIEGFDKYGQAGTQQLLLNDSLLRGEWSNVVYNFTSISLGQPLSSSGQSLVAGLYAGGTYLSKSVGANFARSIGGFQFKFTTAIGTTVGLFSLRQDAIWHVTIGITPTQLVVYRGNNGGTVLGSYNLNPALNTTYSLEWDITINDTTGIAKIYIDGVLVINLTNIDTQNGGNPFYNNFHLGNSATGQNISQNASFDNFYFFGYTAAGGTETPLLNNPSVLTQFPTSDSTPSQFLTRFNLKNNPNTIVTNAATSTNRIFFSVCSNTSFAGQVFGAAWTPVTTVSTLRWKLALYSNNPATNVPATLLAETAEYGGAAAGIAQFAPFITPYNASSGEKLWCAFIGNAGVEMYYTSASGGYRNDPGSFTFPASMTGLSMPASVDFRVMAVMTGAPNQFTQSDDVLPSIEASYNATATTGNVSSVGFGPLPASATSVHCLAVKGLISKTDSTARTMAIEIDSAGTVSGANFNPQFNIQGTYGSVYFVKNPATSTSWTPTTAADVKARVKLVS